MNIRVGWLGLMAAVAGGVFACSGTNGGGGGGSCLQQSASSDCYACAQAHCGSQLGDFESSCTGYISCICPGGTYDACNVSSCSSQVTTTGSCQGADLAFGQCITASCTSECEATTGSSSGGTCTGSSSGGGSGSSSGSVMSCLSSSSTTSCTACIETSCASQLSAVETGCSAYLSCVCPGGVYDANDVTACQSLEMTSTCTGALMPLESCETSSCVSACTTAGSSSGSSSGG